MISKEVWVDIKSLHRQGFSIRHIARELGISRVTVRRYLRNDEPPRYVRTKTKPSLLDPHKDYLLGRLRKLPELPATVLLRELKERGYRGQITLIKDFIRPFRAERRRLQELTVRYETTPGEQAQVDFSDFGRLTSGQKLYGLSVVLAYSRFMFLRFSERMDVQELLFGLVQAFEYFGGLPKKLLFDNAKTVVIKRGKSTKDSKLNSRFADFLGHYGLELMLCRPRRAQTKGKVERPMDYIEKSLAMSGRESWHVLADANLAARLWLDQVANVRVHGTTGVRPIDRLPVEKLLPVSAARPFDLSFSEPRRVHKDCHFSWQGNRYSVPWRHGLSSVLVRRQPEGLLEVERGGELIARHRERPAGKRLTVTLPEHVAGLWHKTLSPKRHKDDAGEALARGDAFAELEVEQRDLLAYDAFLGPCS